MANEIIMKSGKNLRFDGKIDGGKTIKVGKKEYLCKRIQ